MLKTKLTFLLLVISTLLNAQTFTLDDTLRGSITPQRAWWGLLHYNLKLEIVPDQKFIKGSNTITFKVEDDTKEAMQIDLQPPLKIESITHQGTDLIFSKEGQNAYFFNIPMVYSVGDIDSVTITYSGNPKEAVRAPWDGGFSWKTDNQGNAFAATSCQGLGASVWWPCKDHMYDEPDNGTTMTVTVPEGLMDVSNGKLISKTTKDNKTTTVWNVKNPINNYGINVNIGNYTHFSDEYKGLNGPLSLDYFVLPENLEKAKVQFKQVNKMFEAFEHWFGPYPFYEDGFKLVEVPYLGMEHQSSVTYGNNYQNGYLGRDLSGSGWGLKWDFIIIHESGHEWFANNITYKDAADMWIHESFTNYSETLFTDYHFGTEAGQDYIIGSRKNILNDKPIIGIYNVNHEGSSDMYYKGANMIHTIRHIINDDEKFRQILIGLNKTFYHQTVTSQEIENYISEHAEIDLSAVFEQYLRTIKIPKLELIKKRNKYLYCWKNVVPGFDMPIKVTVDGVNKMLYPTEATKKIKGKNITVDKNFYINY